MARLKTIKDIKTLDDFDFLDLGAGEGRSLEYCEAKIGGRGIGIETMQEKVEDAQKRGREVYLGNALHLSRIPGKVDYVVCDNFLEHLPGKKEVTEMLKMAAAVTRKFIYISHPSFEDVHYLKGHGLKTYWSDWTGHTAMLTLSDLMGILHECGIHWVQVHPVYRIRTSDDERIIPLGAGVDKFHYEPSHGPKPKPAIKFDRELYYSFDIIGMMPGTDSHLPVAKHTDRLNSQKHPEITNWKKPTTPSRLDKVKHWARKAAKG
jgi:SAM-dependent methyltransferase